MNSLRFQSSLSFSGPIYRGKFVLSSRNRDYVVSAADQFRRLNPDTIITLRSSESSKRVLVLVGEAAIKFTEELSKRLTEEMQKTGKNVIQAYNANFSQLEKQYTKNKMPKKPFIIDLDAKPKSTGINDFIHINMGRLCRLYEKK